MSIETLMAAIPDYAKDLRLNLANLASEPTLGEQRRWGAFYAAALAARNPRVVEAIQAEAGARLSPAALEAAATAAALMAMNNLYYRFLHLAGDDELSALPARLRMGALARPGVERADFELWCLAVSAVNGCGRCIEAHARALGHAGVGREAIQCAARIAAVVYAVAAVVDGERRLAA